MPPQAQTVRSLIADVVDPGAQNGGRQPVPIDVDDPAGTDSIAVSACGRCNTFGQTDRGVDLCLDLAWE